MARRPKPSGRQIKRGRSNQSYDRRPGNLEPAKSVLIVCEGSKTEPSYFEKLKDKLRLASVEPRPISVQIMGQECLSAPLAIVEYAIKLNRERSKEVRRGTTNKSQFDEIWCVIDTESDPNNSSLISAIDLAKSSRFKLAISNPAFEFWYLLHYEYTTRIFYDANELIRYLQKYIPEYSKSKPPENGLFERLEIAIINAVNVTRQQSLISNVSLPNPSTSVHKLVKSLIDMSHQRRK